MASGTHPVRSPARGSFVERGAQQLRQVPIPVPTAITHQGCSHIPLCVSSAYARGGACSASIARLIRFHTPAPRHRRDRTSGPGGGQLQQVRGARRPLPRSRHQVSWPGMHGHLVESPARMPPLVLPVLLRERLDELLQRPVTLSWASKRSEGLMSVFRGLGSRSSHRFRVCRTLASLIRLLRRPEMLMASGASRPRTRSPTTNGRDRTREHSSSHLPADDAFQRRGVRARAARTSAAARRATGTPRAVSPPPQGLPGRPGLLRRVKLDRGCAHMERAPIGEDIPQMAKPFEHDGGL
jgi:hypothetical protein